MNNEIKLNEILTATGVAPVLTDAEASKQMRIAKILEQTKTNWSVIKLPLTTIPYQRETKYFNHENDTEETRIVNTPIPLTSIIGQKDDGTGGVERGLFAMLRQDNLKVLGTGSEQYTIVQNKEVAEICDAIQQHFPDAAFSVEAKVINDGGSVQYRMKLEDYIPNAKTNVVDNRVFRYITLTNSHDGSSSMQFGIFHQVCVCANGMYIDKNLKVAKLRHTPSIEERIKEAVELFKFALEVEFKMIESYEKMVKVTAERRHIEALIVGLFDAPDTLLVKTNDGTNQYKVVGSYDEAGNLIDHKPEGMSPRKYNQVNKFLSADVLGKEFNDQGNTLWGLLNVATRYTNHNMNKGEDNILVGEGKRKNEMAYSLIEKWI